MCGFKQVNDKHKLIGADAVLDGNQKFLFPFGNWHGKINTHITAN